MRWLLKIGSSMKPLGLSLVLIGVLSACSSVTGMFGGGNDETVLPGERVTVIRTGNKLDVSDISKIPVVVPASYVNSEWSQPGGVASNAPQHVSLNGTIKRVWSASAGKGSSSQGRLVSIPIVAEGKVFVLDTLATVRAFTANDGRRIWSQRLAPKDEEEEEGFGGGLAYEAGRLIVATAFGNVVALDTARGKPIWSKKLGIPIRAAPTVANGRIFVTTLNNQVFALSVTDGSDIWNFRGVAESASLISSTSPAVADGVVVIPYSTGEVMAFSADTGRVIWSDSLSRTGRLSSLSTINNIAGRPVIYRGRAIAISHSGRVAAVDVKTGERIWSRNFPSSQTPWAAGDYIFFVTSANILMAMSHADGKIRWIKRLEKGHWSGPVLAGGRLIVVNSSGKIMNISPYTGTEVSTQRLGEKILIPPIVAGNTLYFLTDDAELIAMR